MRRESLLILLSHSLMHSERINVGLTAAALKALEPGHEKYAGAENTSHARQIAAQGDAHGTPPRMPQSEWAQYINCVVVKAGVAIGPGAANYWLIAQPFWLCLERPLGWDAWGRGWTGLDWTGLYNTSFDMREIDRQFGHLFHTFRALAESLIDEEEWVSIGWPASSYCMMIANKHRFESHKGRLKIPAFLPRIVPAPIRSRSLEEEEEEDDEGGGGSNARSRTTPTKHKGEKNGEEGEAAEVCEDEEEEGGVSEEEEEEEDREDGGGARDLAGPV
ncbi:hypothetical protein AXG93_3524s1060 [Marchantia polymorpha subsp. ruderalis]|uniref:Uncharacterized protein n=1 Tax=Marchantia polymorpha subsp. ruderalis TaxID=1480154 RepID=A0A176WT44_MARPO|nr:hypothetical protein AXG93_3524s1060 [Marchantia polymorpha subsp. ruderalis]